MSQTIVPPIAETVNLSGPRFGMTFLSDGIVKRLANDNGITVGPVAQFGWQFEKQFYSGENGPTAVTNGCCCWAGSSRASCCQPQLAGGNPYEERR